MRKVIPILALLILSTIMSFAQLANSAWPTFRHDLQNTARSLYNGPSSAKEKWSYTTPNTCFDTPVIGSDVTIYAGSNDKNFYAFYPDGTI